MASAKSHHKTRHSLARAHTTRVLWEERADRGVVAVRHLPLGQQRQGVVGEVYGLRHREPAGALPPRGISYHARLLAPPVTLAALLCRPLASTFGSRRLSREGAAGTIRHEETRDSAIGRGRVGIDAASGLGFGARRCGRSQAECIRFPSEPLMCADGTAPRCSVMRAELGERQRSVTLALFCVRYVCVYRARGRQRVSQVCLSCLR